MDRLLTGTQIAKVGAKYRHRDDANWSFNLDGFAQEIAGMVRKDTLKGVGDWLSRPCLHYHPRPRMRRDCLICENLLIEATDKGEMPEEVQGHSGL